MILSRILMVLALAILAYLVFMIMNPAENVSKAAAATASAPPPAATSAATAAATATTTAAAAVAAAVTATTVASPVGEHFTRNENTGCSVNPQPNQENFVYKPAKHNISYEANNKQNIKYETFADIGGMADTVHGAAPFGSKSEMDEGSFAKVNYTGLVDGTPGDVIQIEGTDLLTAPLVDNMLYTNSIANTNRNASQDLRGDIPLQFNDTYTPFYSSVIYGAPLSQKQMTIGNI